MKNLSLFYFIFISCMFSNAQTSRVDYYTLTKNTVDTTNIRTYLLINKKESVFIWNSIVNSESKKSDKGIEGEIKFTKIVNDTIGLRIYNLFSSDSIMVIDKIIDNRYKFSEGKNINWAISQEYKTIGGYKCLKAKTYFRGRNYTAWFTEEIPISSGPWKFNGLPGLILEVIDDKNEVSFKLKSIKSIKFKQDNKLYNDFKFQRITLKNFVEKKDNYFKENYNEFISKLPRGTEVNLVKQSHRNGIEIKFEWEN